MRFLAVLVSLAILAPSADAAVIATTKQKKLPVIEKAFVSDDWQRFGFAIVSAPTTQAYDVWARIAGPRNRKVGEWFVRSMKLRSRTSKPTSAEFSGNLADLLEYSKAGTYVLTLFACPANADKPNEKSCANASVSLVKK